MKIKKKLTELRVFPSKKKGQNFLHDRGIINNLVSSILSLNPLNIIEIGPGLGAVTDLIDGQLKSRNYKLIEIDKLLYDYLRTKKYCCEIFHGDCLKLNWPDLTNNEKFLLFGNLPYNIGTLVLVKWINCQYSDTAIFMLQRELVDRLTSSIKTKTYSGISVITQLTTDVFKLFSVPKEAFYPKPNVESIVVKLVKKSTICHNLQKFIRDCFVHRRKTLFNNLQKTYNEKKIISTFEKYNLAKAIRAEEIKASLFVDLYNEISNPL